MALGSNLILPPKPATVSVEVIPAYQILSSISALVSIESNPGMGEWVNRTYAHLSLEQRRISEIVGFGLGAEGLINLVPPGPNTDSFPAFLAALEEVDPKRLCELTLDVWDNSAHLRVYIDAHKPDPLDRERALHDYDYYASYVNAQLKKEVDVTNIFPEIHTLLAHPHEYKGRVLDFLGYIWEMYLKTEWERIEPELFAVAEAFSQVSLADRTPLDAARVITGRDLSGFLDADALNTFERIRFLPSLHNGPYISWFGNETDLYLVFGARMPEPQPIRRNFAPRRIAVDHSTLFHRLNALADQTRFDILLALHEKGPMGTQEIMDAFDLNKSAASRHLRSLNASGLIEEQRESDNRTKFYVLAHESIRQLTDTLNQLLG